MPALTQIPPYGEPISAKIADLVNNSVAYAERCNVGLGCAVATNSQYFKNQAGVDAAIPALDLSALVDSALGSYNVILPPLANGDHNVEIVKVSADANIVTVKCYEGDTFADGTNTFILYNQNDFLDLLANSELGLWAVRGFRQFSYPTDITPGSLNASIWRQNGAQTFSQNSPTAIIFDTVNFDATGMWNGTTKLTAATAGKYAVTGNVIVSSQDASGNNSIAIRKNGTTIAAVQSCPALGSGWSASLSVTSFLSLVAGDYVELIYTQSMSTIVAIAGNAGTNLSAIWVAP